MKYILSYKVRPDKGGITMHDTMLTYDQWKHRFKRALKKTIRKKIESIMWTVLTISVFILPFWMVLDWLLRGY